MTGFRGVFAAVAVSALLSGCSLHSPASEPTSLCVRTLPYARQAVHGQGKLVSVRTISPPRSRRVLHAPGNLVQGPTACVVTYRGPYSAGSVIGAGSQAGLYAHVVVRLKHPAVSRVTVNNRRR